MQRNESYLFDDRFTSNRERNKRSHRAAMPGATRRRIRRATDSALLLLVLAAVNGWIWTRVVRLVVGVG